jgi:SAM-dependent methyltransferase
MRPDATAATFRCPSCGFFASTLPIAINASERLDEHQREAALRALRFENFTVLLDACEREVPAPAALLDVGCAHGWFLSEAASRGYRATGVEPDTAMAAQAAAAGNRVLVGYFPDVLPPGEVYDLITFNDVLEHLPDVPAAVDAVRAHLSPRGAVMINLPVSDGPVFRLARVAARVGVRGPLMRLWQQGMPSPHLSYFSAATLERLMRARGFELAARGRLASVSTTNLWERIRYDRATGLAPALAYFAGARALAPVLRLFASDIQYFVFRAVPARTQT